MRAGRDIIQFHPMSVHFTDSLYPVSLFFLTLYLITKEDSFRTTYGYIISLAAVSTPVAYMTGLVDWRQKYRSSMVRLFSLKLQLGIALMAVGASCALWYWADRGILTRGGTDTLIFALLNFSLLPLVMYLAYLGRRLVYWRPH